MRLNILLEADVISDKVYKESLSIIDYIVENVSNPELEKLEVFVTHISIALNRIYNKEDDFEVNSELYDSLKEDPDFIKAKSLLKGINNLIDIELPLGEKTLILIHLCNILKEEGAKV